MRTSPRATDLLQSVIAHLQTTVLPKLTGREAFDTKVAVRALGIVQRELELRPDAEARELARLQNLLRVEGPVEALNRQLCEAIGQDRIDLNTPGLIEHLWATTLDTLAIDQPTYATYQAVRNDQETPK